jgi:hypothetical protein
MIFRAIRKLAALPSSFSALQGLNSATQKQQLLQLPKLALSFSALAKSFSLKSSCLSNINAERLLGVFFGRLIRRFGSVPSRRISRPSAAFISVNRHSVQSSVRLFAPMNNPYCPHRVRTFMLTDGFQP